MTVPWELREAVENEASQLLPGALSEASRRLAAAEGAAGEEDSSCRILDPCPHGGACPMQGTSGWCHFARRLERSRRHRVAKDAARGFEDEKFAYMAAQKPKQGSPSLAKTTPGSGRIVDVPAVSKGGVVLSLCGPDGLKVRAVSRRDKEDFRSARKARWGDWWEEETRGGRGSAPDSRTPGPGQALST